MPYVWCLTPCQPCNWSKLSSSATCPCRLPCRLPSPATFVLQFLTDEVEVVGSAPLLLLLRVALPAPGGIASVQSAHCCHTHLQASMHGCRQYTGEADPEVDLERRGSGFGSDVEQVACARSRLVEVCPCPPLPLAPNSTNPTHCPKLYQPQHWAFEPLATWQLRPPT